MNDSHKSHQVSKLLKGVSSHGGSFSHSSVTKLNEELTLKPNMAHTMNEPRNEQYDQDMLASG